MRISIVTTRMGDGGTTTLADGTRLAKDAPRIEALGQIDELNSVIGLLRTEPMDPGLDTLLARIQNDLFDLGAELSIPEHPAFAAAHVRSLDENLEQYKAGLAPLREFILPGGSRGAALAHLARTVCRRAERALVALGAQATVTAAARQYLNRLSDLCFVLARVLNRRANHADVLWDRALSPRVARPPREEGGTRERGNDGSEDLRHPH